MNRPKAPIELTTQKEMKMLAWRLYEMSCQQPLIVCCHTCEKYMENGICLRFDTRPPDNFVEKVGGCDGYVELQEIPF